MALFLHRAERADRLADGLAALLADPLPDPFAEEIVAVPARGVERWLAQRLSHSLGSSGAVDGICANIRFPSPGVVIREVIGAPDVDPWAPENLVWPLLETIDAALGEDWCRTLTAHLGADPADHRRGRRYAVARRLAGLFSSYAEYRPSILREWAAGRDTDGLPGSALLSADLRWQAELWRRLATRVAGPDPVSRVDAALTAIESDPGRCTLPERVSVFGSTRLPALWLRVLSAVSAQRDVHLWLPHPSPELWRRLASAHGSVPVRRRLDTTALVARQPLLSSLGRDARELQAVLSETPSVDEHLPSPELPATLLGRLQQSIRSDSAPAATPWPLAVEDRSVQLHACHGPTRQVEVLREVVTGLLAADPTLEPRDVIVMCPDIETFAPYLKAAFGAGPLAGPGHPAQAVPVRLADRALHRTTGLLTAITMVLNLAGGRVTRTEVLDLVSLDAVRHRFGFDDADLELIDRWTAEAGVRWGIDARHRAPYALQGLPHGTWRSGLDRLLLGVAMAEPDGWAGPALPLDDVGSNDIELAGRFAEFLDRLTTTLDELTGPHSLAEWTAVLGRAGQRLTALPDQDSWQAAAWHRQLAEISDGAGARAADTPLALTDVRALFASRLAGRPTRANFRTGGLTVCSMVPMRSVPHRVVCLLGMDDGVFPRSAHPDGDDILAQEPVVGERDARGEDRQLLLDALLAATGTVVVLYSGADERTGAERPPAVPVGELIDAIDRTAVTADGEPAHRQILVRHPLQPFDRRSFTAGELGVPGPFSYDEAMSAAAHAAAMPRHRSDFVDRLSASPGRSTADGRPTAVNSRQSDAVLDLSELVGVLGHPVRELLRRRLGVAVDGLDVVTADNLPIEVDDLHRWTIAENLLTDQLSGVDLATCRQREWRRGRLPPGPLGGRLLEQLVTDVEPLVTAVLELRAGTENITRTIDLTLDDGRRLRGGVNGVHGHRLISVGYRKVAAMPLLRAWIDLVALTAAEPDVPWTATVIGRHSSGRPWRSTLGPIGHDLAWQVLAEQVDLFDRGESSPLPMALRSSAAYARARRDHADAAEAVAAARLIWSGDQGPGENAGPEHQLVWGHRSDLEALTDRRPERDEQWFGEPSRFGELARRLWAPLFAAEHEEPLP